MEMLLAGCDWVATGRKKKTSADSYIALYIGGDHDAAADDDDAG